MFARKRKPRDEEPLVPHGMIWQATEESMPSGNAEKPAPEQHPSNTKPIEMPKFWHDPASAPDTTVRRGPVSVRSKDELPQDIPKKIEAKAEPLRWPLAPIRELTRRRMLIQEERTEAKPTTSHPASLTPPAPPVAWPDQAASSSATAPAKPILVSTPTATDPMPPAQCEAVATAEPSETQPKPSETQSQKIGLRKRVVEVLASVNRIGRGIATGLVELARACRAATVRGFSELGRRAKSIYDARALANKMRLAMQVERKTVSVSISHPGTDSQPQIQPESTMTTQVKSAAAWLRFHSDRRIEAFTSFTRNLRNQRVRIRIVAGASPFKIFRSLSQTRVLAAATLRKNNRLLAPLLMAALSAVLALGVIVSVKHYEPVNRATLVKQTPVPAGSLTPPTLAMPQSSLKSASTAVATPASVQSALRMPGKATSREENPAIRAAVSQKQVGRRHHRNEDEDYVAKDTYIYYGKP